MVKNIATVLKMVDKYHDDIDSVYFRDKTENTCKCTIKFRFGFSVLSTPQSCALVEIINHFIRETGAVLQCNTTSECVRICLLVKL